MIVCIKPLESPPTFSPVIVEEKLRSSSNVGSLVKRGAAVGKKDVRQRYSQVHLLSAGFRRSELEESLNLVVQIA